MSTPWYRRFVDFMRYLRRDCGWRVPFILHGQRLTGVGIVPPPGPRFNAANDN